MNCMLQRELCPSVMGMRLLDTYFSEYSNATVGGVISGVSTADMEGGEAFREAFGDGPSATGQRSSTAILSYHCYVCAALLIHAYGPIVMELVDPKGVPLPPQNASASPSQPTAAGSPTATGPPNLSSTTVTLGSGTTTSRSSPNYSFAAGKVLGDDANSASFINITADDCSGTFTSRGFSSSHAERPKPPQKLDFDVITDDMKDLLSSAVLSLLQNPAMFLSLSEIVNAAAATGTMRWAGLPPEQRRDADEDMSSTLTSTDRAEVEGLPRPPSYRPYYTSFDQRGSPGVPDDDNYFCGHGYPTSTVMTLVRRRFDEVLSQAYLLQTLYQNSPAQLGAVSSGRGTHMISNNNTSLPTSVPSRHAPKSAFAAFIDSISDKAKRRSSGASHDGVPPSPSGRSAGANSGAVSRSGATSPQPQQPPKKEAWLQNWFRKSKK